MSDHLTSQITRLLQDDQNCEGRVLNSTVQAIALLLQPKPESGDVLEERAACAEQMHRVLTRIAAIEVERIGDKSFVPAEALLTERRRFAQAIESMQLGLHRAADRPAGPA